MSKKVVPFRGLSLLAERLKKARDIMKLSQGEVAANLGVSVAAVSAWEKGKAEPPLGYLSYLVEEHAFNLNWLLFGKGEIRLIGEEYYLKTGFRLLTPEDRENYEEDEFVKSQIFKAGIKTFLTFEWSNDDKLPTMAGIAKKLNMEKDRLVSLLSLSEDKILPESLQREISDIVGFPLGQYELVMAVGREVLKLPEKNLMTVIKDVEKVIYGSLNEKAKDINDNLLKLNDALLKQGETLQELTQVQKELNHVRKEKEELFMELNQVRKELGELRVTPTVSGMETAISITLDD